TPATAAHSLCGIPVRAGRPGAVQPGPSPGPRPALDAAPGHAPARATRPEAAARARIAGAHLRQVRADAVDAARPDPRRYRRRTGAAARPRAAVSLGPGSRLHRDGAGRAAVRAVRAIRSRPGGFRIHR